MSVRLGIPGNDPLPPNTGTISWLYCHVEENRANWKDDKITHNASHYRWQRNAASYMVQDADNLQTVNFTDRLEAVMRGWANHASGKMQTAFCFWPGYFTALYIGFAAFMAVVAGTLLPVAKLLHLQHQQGNLWL